MSKLRDIKDQRPMPWSQQVWGLDWSSIMPITLKDSIRCEYRRYDQIKSVMASLFSDVYLGGNLTTRFASHASPEAFEAYYQSCGDFFLFLDGANDDAVVGLGCCTVIDATSYYFRNCAIAPDYQKTGVYSAFFDVLCEEAKRHGVKRIEGDISPTNRHHMHILNRMGYVVTSTSVSLQWGNLVRVTKFLDEADEVRFGELFSFTHESDLKANRSPRKKGAA